MARYVQCAIVFALVFGNSWLVADDAAELANLRSEIQLLRKDNELLKVKLELAERTLKELADENESLKKGKEDVPARKAKGAKSAPRANLSELLAAQTVLKGEYTFVGKKLYNGSFTLTIQERDGQKFKGTFTASGGLNVEVEGALTGERIRFYSINSSRKINVIGARKGEALHLDYSNEIGDHFAMVAKLP